MNKSILITGANSGLGKDTARQLGLIKETEKIYACKIMRNYDEEKERTSRAEFELISQLKPHPNIIEAVEFISTVDRTYNILECATGIEL